MKRLSVLDALGFAAGLVSVAPASTGALAADAAAYGERTTIQRGWGGALPACSDPEVERRITSNFAHTERTYWKSNLELTAFHRPVQVAYSPWGPSFIPRRFCTAKTVTTDGRRRDVVYSVREWQSWGTISWGVEWCVTGLDRSMAYAPSCKMAGP